MPPGCYDFTIFDAWGDGMCCAYGQGGYTVIEEASGIILASGGSFNREETKTLCLPLDNSNATIDYCGANGRNTQYEWIETVEIGDQVFNSGNDGGYGDYIDTEVTVDIGGTLPLAFTPGFGFFKYHENWQIWIDFNSDGDFEDEGENVFLASGNERVTGTIGIPSGLTPGKTRMRVAMKWGELVEPCESFSWGEVEDYTLNLVSSASIGERNALPTHSKVFRTGNPQIFTTQSRFEVRDLAVYPNPATDFVTLVWEEDQAQAFQLVIINNLGQEVANQTIVGQVGTNKIGLNVSHYPNGLYRLSLIKGDKLINKDFIVLK